MLFARVALASGWQTIEIPVDPGGLAVGENQLVLETSGGKEKIAVAWLRLAEKSAPDDPRIAVVVALEAGQTGGRDAAPIARKILDAWVEAERATAATGGAGP